MAKPDKADSTSTAAESKTSNATSSTATPIDTSSKPDGYKSLSDVDKAYIDSILESLGLQKEKINTRDQIYRIIYTED